MGSGPLQYGEGSPMWWNGSGCTIEVTYGTLEGAAMYPIVTFPESPNLVSALMDDRARHAESRRRIAAASSVTRDGPHGLRRFVDEVVRRPAHPARLSAAVRER